MKQGEHMKDRSSSPASGHRRNASSHARRQAVLRRSTNDPLETAVDNGEKSSTKASSRVSNSLSFETQRGVDDGQDSPAANNIASSSSSPSSSPGIKIVEQSAKDFSFLLHPSNFHVLNEQDIPTALRHNPVELQRETLQGLLDKGYFFAAAVVSAEQLKGSTAPTDHFRIFDLLFVRFACLQILSLHGLAAQESKCLQDLSAPIYRNEDGQHLVPWRLRVLAVRLQAIGFNDWRRGIMAYYELASEARLRAKQSSSRELQGEKLRELGILVANALIEMGDLSGAVRHMKTLLPGGAQHRVRMALLYLRLGDIPAAWDLLAPSRSSSNKNYIWEAVYLMAKGEYENAAKAWQTLLSAPSSARSSSPSPSESSNQVAAEASGKEEGAGGADSGERGMIAQNLAVCLIYTGAISDAKVILERLIDGAEDTQLNRGTTFNLATIYELTTDKSKDAKIAMSKRVAERLADNEAEVGKRIGKESVTDWMNADFKL